MTKATGTAVPIESACWRALACSEAPASCHASAPSYRNSKDVFSLAIVESKLKFVQVERQVFLAYMMIGADDSALKQRPEAINILSVYFTAHILASGVSYRVMSIAQSAQGPIARRFIGRNQINLIAYRHLNKTIEGANIHSFDHLTDHITLTADRADDRNLPRWTAPNMQALVGVFVLFFSAQKGFVNFDDAHQLLEVWVFHSGPEPMTHIESTLIRSGADHPMNLKRADSFLRREHQVQDFKPRAKGHLGFLKNRSGLEGEAVRRAVILAAFLTLPVPRSRGTLVHVIVLASRAERSSGPAMQKQIRPARLLVRKHPIEIGKRHLADETGFVLFVIGHASDISEKQDGSQLPDNAHFLTC